MIIENVGQRQEFDSGMKRGNTDAKIDWSLVMDGPLLQRWAVHMTAGAKTYEKRNWMKAESVEELARFRESACRHFFQAMAGEEDEDHVSALLYNLNGMLYVQDRLAVTLHGHTTAQRTGEEAV